jgi:DNA-binding transcriptional LysR family regulator
MPLFEQVGKKIFPTAAGQALYEASCDILSRIDQLRDTVDDLQGKVKGPLRLSVVSTTEYFMPHLLGAFLQQYPDVEPKLRFTNRETVVQRLHDNLEDFVVMGQIPDDEAMEAYPFLENIVAVVAHPRHPLAGKNKVALKDLVSQRLLVREQGSGTRMAVDRRLAEHGITIEPYMELGSNEAIKQGVMAGLGIAAMSLHSVTLERRAGLLKVLTVQGFPIKRRWYVVHLKGKRLSLVARTFLDFILAHSEEALRDNANVATADEISSVEQGINIQEPT